jgi:hypothetical protein
MTTRKSWRAENPNTPCCNLRGALCTDCRFNTEENRIMMQGKAKLPKKEDL